MFSALRQGSTLYVLSMEGRPKVYVAQVTEFTNPTPKLVNTPPMYGQPQPMTVDIKATDGKTNFQFDKLDANAVVFEYTGNNVVATNLEALNVKWDEKFTQSKRHVEDTPYHQGVLDAAPEIMAVLNPQYAKEQEREKKIGNLEQKVSGMESTLSDIREMLNTALNGNTNSRKTKE